MSTTTPQATRRGVLAIDDPVKLAEAGRILRHALDRRHTPSDSATNSRESSTVSDMSDR